MLQELTLEANIHGTLKKKSELLSNVINSYVTSRKKELLGGKELRQMFWPFVGMVLIIR